MTESTATLNLRKALNDVGWFIKVSDRYVAGIPDLVGCVEGCFVGIEMKVDGNTPTALQKMNLAAIESRGGLPFVCTYDRKDKVYKVKHIHTVHSRGFDGSAKEVAEWILKLCLIRTRRSASN